MRHRSHTLREAVVEARGIGVVRLVCPGPMRRERPKATPLSIVLLYRIWLLSPSISRWDPFPPIPIKVGLHASVPYRTTNIYPTHCPPAESPTNYQRVVPWSCHQHIRLFTKTLRDLLLT